MKYKQWIIGLILPFLMACSIKQAPLEIEHWRIMPDRDAAARKNQVKYWLTQGTMTVVSPFDTKSFVYRLDDQKYEKDFYNEYVTIPSDMFAVATRQWLNESGIFQFAVVNSNALLPLYVLQGTVDDFYTDFRKNQPTVVVLTIEYYLSSADGVRKNNVLFKKRYSQTQQIKDNSAKSIASAQQIALTKILQQLEDDLVLESNKFPKP
jgi:ABC-type uncharacterized transport system auxiliary subunit